MFFFFFFFPGGISFGNRKALPLLFRLVTALRELTSAQRPNPADDRTKAVRDWEFSGSLFFFLRVVVLKELFEDTVSRLYKNHKVQLHFFHRVKEKDWERGANGMSNAGRAAPPLPLFCWLEHARVIHVIAMLCAILCNCIIHLKRQWHI